MQKPKFKTGHVLTIKENPKYFIYGKEHKIIRILKTKPYYYWEYYEKGSWINKGYNTDIVKIETDYRIVGKNSGLFYAE